MWKRIAGFLAGLVLIASTTYAAALPVLTIGVSEYPSWVTFLVACSEKLIGCKAGAIGPLEEKWGVDINVKATVYDTTLSMYGNAAIDAAAITNTDAVVSALSQPGVAILATSTSDRADALLVPKSITNIKQLRGKKIHGLAESVSQYVFVRNLMLLDENERDYEWSPMDPGVAALAMQQRQAGFDAIMVWEPYVIETLKKRPDVHTLVTSGAIPLEVIDMVVMPLSALKKQGGQAFAYAVADTYYAINKLLNDPARRDDILLKLRKQFAPSLSLEDMRRVVKEVKFFDTPEKGVELFTGTILPEKMKVVLDYTVRLKKLKQPPKVTFGSENGGAALQFDPTYMQQAITAQQ